MRPHILTLSLIQEYRGKLYEEEKSKATIDKYVRDIRAFYNFLPDDKKVVKAEVIQYKEILLKKYKASSINSMLIALNVFFTQQHWDDCRIKLIKVQKSAFRDSEEGMSKEEYARLIGAANDEKKPRLAMALQTICSTGIRVSELQYITVEAVKDGKVVVNNKGKVRIILIPPELQERLKQYCTETEIRKGMIFTTKNGKPMDRSNIWREMKNLSVKAHVEEKKVYPHNLRHLFAVTYYEKEKNIIYLSDVLGHSSMETTRIYTRINDAEHFRRISGMGLVLSEQ